MTKYYFDIWARVLYEYLLQLEQRWCKFVTYFEHEVLHKQWALLLWISLVSEKKVLSYLAFHKLKL
jgi:hypothetical protein